MAQNVLLKYGDTSVISGETIQQGKILIDTQKGEISIDKDGTTRLPLTPTVDSALSTTSTNPIANNAITNSIINTTAEVSAITADNIPCGTKPVKELITNLNVLDAVNAILVNELKTSGNSKTFDKSGILFIQTGTTAQTYLYLNSALIGSGFYSTVIPNHAGGTDCRQLLISKGDTLTSGGSGGTTGTMSLKFVPYK